MGKHFKVSVLILLPLLVTSQDLVPLTDPDLSSLVAVQVVTENYLVMLI